MKQILLAALLSTTALGAAYAADILQPDLPLPTPAPEQTLDSRWGGIYVGVQGGYGWGNSEQTIGAVSSGAIDTDGWLGGVTLGYNHQTPNNFVLGVEGDLSLSNADGSSSAAACAGTCTTELNWFGTARARAGYAYGNVLPYVTGGLAVAEVDASNGTGSGDKTAVGWTAGLGLEYLVRENISVKSEYLYSKFDEDIATGTGSTNFDDLHTARVGLNVKF